MVARVKQMSETWFTSDTHFGHSNILKYEPDTRPFETLELMHEALISRWNNVVKPNDKVYHLGDFCMGGRKNIEFAKALNGTKILILGNHDCYGAKEYLLYFKYVHGALFWNDCILTHVPVHPHNLKGQRCKFNIHGHLHSKKIDDTRYINVGCEQNNLTPINSDLVLKPELW